MLVFLVRQTLNLKRAILGRRQPHQLAWGLALGLLLGLVPYGNLLALLILLLILSLAVNHGMAAVAAVAMSAVAAHIDPQSHAVGNYLLTHPELASYWATFWQWPFVPWTDINNTVVLGSLVIGTAALVPTYLVSYPIFHWLAPATHDLPREESLAGSGEAKRTIARVDPPHVVSPHADSSPAPAPHLALSQPSTAAALGDHAAAGDVRLGGANTQAVDAALCDVAEVPQWPSRRRGSQPGQRAGKPQAAGPAASQRPAPSQPAASQPAAEQPQKLVNTRIEVVRMYPAAAASPAASSANQPAANQQDGPPPAPASELAAAAAEADQHDPPMSEALNYLLRQLRETRHGRAA